MQHGNLRLVDGNGLPARPRHHEGHVVRFYEHDDFLVATVADYLAEGLIAGQPIMAITTEERAAALTGRLRANGFDLASLSSRAASRCSTRRTRSPSS